MSTSTFYLLDKFKTIRLQDGEKAQDWLGRVTTNHAEPPENITKNSTAAFLGKIYSDGGVMNASEYLDSKRGHKIASKLADVLQTSISDAQASSRQWKASRVEHLRMDSNYKAVYSQLKQNPDARAELTKVMEDKSKAFLIIGVLTTDLVSFSDKKSSDSEASVKAKLPTKEVLDAIGAPPTADIPFEITANKTNTEQTKGDLNLVGKRIFAIQYRILRKPWYLSRSKTANYTEETLKGEGTFAGGDDEDSEEEEDVDEDKGGISDLELDDEALLEDDVDDEENLF